MKRILPIERGPLRLEHALPDDELGKRVIADVIETTAAYAWREARANRIDWCRTQAGERNYLFAVYELGEYVGGVILGGVSPATPGDWSFVVADNLPVALPGVMDDPQDLRTVRRVVELLLDNKLELEGGGTIEFDEIHSDRRNLAAHMRPPDHRARFDRDVPQRGLNHQRRTGD